MDELKSVTGKNYQTQEEITFNLGDKVRWLQPELNRYLEGEIIGFKENLKVPNRTGVRIKLTSEKIVNVNLYLLF
jgi:hypothetical protein